MTTNNPIIVLTGPTGSGKTALSLEIAEKYDCEIICADSTTVYRGMDIGTDKPVHTQIPHHLLDIIDPDEEFNVSIFQEKATKLIHEIQVRGNIPLIVGGAVMYIDALVFNYDLPPVAPNEKLRQELEKLETSELFDKLVGLDPDSEWTIDKKNRRRIIRAIEVLLATERPFSEQKSKTPLPKNVLYLAIDRDREKLYEDIDKRVDQMFRDGFIEEVKQLLPKYRATSVLQSTGYKQVTEFLDGKITLEEAVGGTKQAHRNYAKRQLTWLRKNPDVRWIDSAGAANASIDTFLASH